MQLGMSLSLRTTQELRQGLSQEQRLALKLKQELKLKLSMKQCLKLVQKLWPKMSLQLGPQLEQRFTQLLKHDKHFREDLPQYLESNPTALQVQRRFPQTSGLFNAHYQTRSDYGTLLRQRQVVKQRQGPSLTLGLRQSMSLRQSISLPTTNWSLVSAFDDEGSGACKIGKRKLPGNLNLDERLKIVDEANKVFRFDYGERGDEYIKVPLLRNFNIDQEEIAITISEHEYTQATDFLEKAGRIQRIVRAVPYTEIRRSLLDHLEEQDVHEDDAVIVGVDRGGRLPSQIVKSALGKNISYFLKVDQGQREIDSTRLDDFIKGGTFTDKYLIFVDSTVDSGRQIRALQGYFDDPDMNIGHLGWIVVGSNDRGESLEKHVNLDWGLDPDHSFEDNPQLMGVDYGQSMTEVKAVGNKMATYLKRSLLEVPKGIILEGSYISEEINVQSLPDHQVEPKKTYQPKLLIIGNAKEVTLDEQDAKQLALKLEHGFQVSAGTPGGNPGYILNLIADYADHAPLTLFQPTYADQRNSNGIQVIYTGKTKDQFRDNMIKEADIILALGGQEGTWTETLKAVAQGKPVFIVKDFELPGEKAGELAHYSNLKLVESIEQVAKELQQYR